MSAHRIVFFVALIALAAAASCAPATPAPEANPPVAATESKTDTPAPLDSPSPAETAILETALSETSSQAVIYDNGEDILSIDPAGGEAVVLVSRAELKSLLPPDRSAESYTFGYSRPFEIDLAPDLTSALVNVCAALDERFRCVFDSFVYGTQNKLLIKLPLPTGLHGVYWQWSPDGSMLAGAGWTYNSASYTLTRFYAVQKNGFGLQSPDAVNHGHGRIAWHPGGRVILPLTFASSFASLFVDGSPRREISILELKPSDEIKCLSFSPDNMRVALVVRSESPANRHRVYIARSDFVAPALLTEYNVDPRYLCEATWSPDQRFLSVGYVYEPGTESGQERIKELAPLGKIIETNSGALVELLANSKVCLWSPDGLLLYKKAGLEGEGARIEAIRIPGGEAAALPQSWARSMTDCPLRWFEKAPELEIPQGLPKENACRPGETYKDDVNPAVMEISPLFDVIEASSTLQGETLEVLLTMDVMTDDLTAYLTPGVTQYLNGWDVLIDIDNNLLTGDRSGVEYRFSVVVRPPSGGNSALLGSAILKFDPLANNYVRFDSLAVSFRSEERMLAMKGTIPGIRENSRLLFLSRVAKGNSNTDPNFGGDRICD